MLVVRLELTTISSIFSGAGAASWLAHGGGWLGRVARVEQLRAPAGARACATGRARASVSAVALTASTFAARADPPAPFLNATHETGSHATDAQRKDQGCPGLYAGLGSAARVHRGGVPDTDEGSS